MQGKTGRNIRLLLQLLLLLCFLLPGLSAKAQEDTRELPSQRWKELREEMEYVERQYKKEKKEEEKEEEPVEKDTSSSDDASGVDFSGFFGSAIVKGVMIAISVIVLMVLVYLILKNQGRSNVKVNKKTSAQQVLEEVEENLEEADIPHFLDEALKAGDYQLAIRLYFLKVLQVLTQSKHIDWKRDKTNAEYVEEMAANPYAGQFRQVTRIFEKVWYGDIVIDEQVYHLASGHFEAFIKHFEKEAEDATTKEAVSHEE